MPKDKFERLVGFVEFLEERGFTRMHINLLRKLIGYFFGMGEKTRKKFLKYLFEFDLIKEDTYEDSYLVLNKNSFYLEDYYRRTNKLKAKKIIKEKQQQ